MLRQAFEVASKEQMERLPHLDSPAARCPWTLLWGDSGGDLAGGPDSGSESAVSFGTPARAQGAGRRCETEGPSFLGAFRGRELTDFS